MKVAIFGASGQLGRDVAGSLRTEDVIAIDHARADIRQAEPVLAALEQARPGWVVNAAAMTHVDACESDALAAFDTNALGARNVARGAEAVGARLVHISTDYVFDGAATGAYVETDLPRPINVYGASKLAGEWLALAECPRTIVVRTSGLYGLNPCRGKGTNFVETILARAAKGPLRVVDDERLTPTWAADLAEQLRVLMQHDAPAGVYHATNAGSCSWHEFALEIVKLAGLSVAVEPISKKEWKAPARRPANSTLENRALATLGLDRMPHWRDALARYFAARTANRPR